MLALSLWIAWRVGLASAQPAGEWKIVSDVSLVVVDVGVRDRQGQPVPGLSKDAFRVLDNGQPRPLAAFSREDAPVSVGLAVDCSGSMQRKRGELLAAAAGLVEASHPEDETFLVTFNDWVRSPPSGTPALLRRMLEATAVEGRTALFDGMKTALQRLAGGKWERKTLVVISDGADNASQTTRSEILRLALRAHATIYTIGILDDWEPDRSPAVLREIASLTGGAAHIDVPAAELTDVCRRVAAEIRSRYMIAFHAAQPSREQVRRIRIEVTAPFATRVSARRSYLAAPASEGRTP